MSSSVFGRADVPECAFWGREEHELMPVIATVQNLISALSAASPPTDRVTPLWDDVGMDFFSVRTLIVGTVLADVEACRRELGHVRRGRGMLDAREVEVLARLDELTVEAP